MAVAEQHENITTGPPLITTIIPTYRRPEMLRRAILSVLNQTYPHFEVCVYDNASGDNTEATVRSFSERDPRIRYFCHDTNVGAARNFSYGYLNVTTPYFSFLSDDDILLPNFFSDALFGFREYPDAVLSSLLTIRMDEGGDILRIGGAALRPGYYQAGEGLIAMLKYGSPEWTATLFRKRVIKEVEYSFEERMGTDKILQYKCAGRYPAFVSDKPGAVLIAHDGSFSTNEGRKSDPKKWLSWMLELHERLTQDPHIPQNVRLHLRKKYGKFKNQRFSVDYGIKCVLDGHFEEAHRAKASCACVAPFWKCFLLGLLITMCQKSKVAHKLAVETKRLHTRLKRGRLIGWPLTVRYGWCKGYVETLTARDPALNKSEGMKAAGIRGHGLRIKVNTLRARINSLCKR